MLLVAGITNTFPVFLPALLAGRVPGGALGPPPAGLPGAGHRGRGHADRERGPSLPLFLLGIGNNLGAAVGPWLSGLLFDRTGSYLAIYLCALGVALTGLTALSVFCLVTRAAPAIRPA